MDDTLKEHLIEFMDALELVFDHEWSMTLDVLRGDGSGSFIAQNGTFLDPRVEDESNNWANRATFLECYRNLAESMTIAGIKRNQY